MGSSIGRISKFGISPAFASLTVGIFRSFHNHFARRSSLRPHALFGRQSCSTNGARMHGFWSGVWIGAGILAAASGGCFAWAQQPEPAGQLVREVSYNELHDHERHGFWRYWVEKHLEKSTRLEEQVETSAGTLARLVSADGRPPDERTQQDEQARLDRLMRSPQEQASQRQSYEEEE